MLATPASSGGGGCRRLLNPFIFLWKAIRFAVTVGFTIIAFPFRVLFAILSTLLSTIATYFPLLVVVGLAYLLLNTWTTDHAETLSLMEYTWRCDIEPIFAPLAMSVGEIVEPYEDAVCNYNAFGFSNRVSSSKTIKNILLKDANQPSLWSPVITLAKGVLNTVARIMRFLLGLWSNRLPVFASLKNVEDLGEVFAEITNALCRDLHPGFFYLGRAISNDQLYCALDNVANAGVATGQYYLTYIYEFIKSMLQLITQSIATDFTSFVDNFRTTNTEISPLLNVPSERLAMASIHTGEYFNQLIQSLICTVVTEIDLHQNDSTLVNGTLPPTHTSLRLGPGQTFLKESNYMACMNQTRPGSNLYHINIFGTFAHLGVVLPRTLLIIQKIYPAGWFRMFWEFITQAGPISDNGSLGFDINTPMPNNSTRFLLSSIAIDSIWDSLRKPLDTLRRKSTIETWPLPALYGKNSPLYDPIENTTTLCYGSFVNIPYQENLYCKECYYNRTEANVVTQIGIFADDIDDLLEPYLDRRLFRPLLHDIVGGLIRAVVALAKWVVDNPVHVVSGFDEAGIFYARQNYYDVWFDEMAGKPHELGGVLKGVVNFFVAIHPNLHVVPKFVVLLVKPALELVRNVVRLIPMLLNTLKSAQGNPIYGPRIQDFFCLTGSNYCIDVEEQFFKWIRIPRNTSQVQFIMNSFRQPLPGVNSLQVFNLGISSLDMAHIDSVYSYIANNYTEVLYGDVYDLNVTVLPEKFGWLECIRFFLSPGFVNGFITNPADRITEQQFPDITCGLYFAGRCITELVKMLAELGVGLLQTVFDLFSNTNPNMPAVVIRWLACTEPDTCIPLLEALSDTEDFVQCPCKLVGPEFLNVPCLCNVTNSVGLAANQLLRASVNVELAASQLIVCVTEFPGGATNETSRACYAIVFDRVIDVFTKAYNATEDANTLGGGIGCLIGLTDPIPCGSLPSGEYLSKYSSELGYYATKFIFSIARSILHLLETVVRFLRDTVLGTPTNSNPADEFTFRNTIETVLNETVIPLIGDPDVANSEGLLQSAGYTMSCVFGTGLCTITDKANNQCPGWFLVKIGDKLREIYPCLIKIIGNVIGFFENLFSSKPVAGNITGALEGLFCLFAKLASTLLEIFLGIVGGLLDGLFGTGTTISSFLQQAVGVVNTIITVLQGLFFDVGEAFECSTCWTGCLYNTWNKDHPFGPDPGQSVCNGCYCTCKCQRPTLGGLPCRVDWDNDGSINDQEVFTPVNPNLGLDCNATKKRKRALIGEGNLSAWWDNNTQLVIDEDEFLPDSITAPSAALGVARNYYQSLAAFVAQRDQQLTTRQRGDSSLCSQLLRDTFNQYASTPEKFDSLQSLMGDASSADKALFMGCYSMMVAPSLLNDRLSSYTQVKLPSSLLLDRSDMIYWMQSAMETLNTYAQWTAQMGNLEVPTSNLDYLLQMQRNQSEISFEANVKKRALNIFGKKRTDVSVIGANVPSFTDALVLAGTTRNPNMRLFAEQLDDYVSRGRTTERVANRLATSLAIAQQTTIFDSLIEMARGARASLGALNPQIWSQMVQSSIATMRETTPIAVNSVKLLSDTFSNPNMTQQPSFGPLGTRNNPNFRVLSGETRTEKLFSLVNFYGAVWSQFKVEESAYIQEQFTAGMQSVQNRLASSETILRTFESYEVLQTNLEGAYTLPKLDARLSSWIASIRVAQNQAPIQGLALAQDIRHQSVITDECNVTRCFECAIITDVIDEIVGYFEYCAKRDNVNSTLYKRRQDISVDQALAQNPDEKLVSDDFLFGVGSTLNRIALFVRSSQMDPFAANATAPLGLWFYFTTFSPIPFVGYCDRDLHTTCQFGLGFGWGVAVLLILSVGLLLLWLFMPSTAGSTTSLLAIAGYIYVAISIVILISWGLTPACLQSPSISLLTLIAPVQTPIIPECGARDFADSLKAFFVPCISFLEEFIANTSSTVACPSCPDRVTFKDCREQGFDSALTTLVYGINWAAYQLGIQSENQTVFYMPPSLSVTDPEDERCLKLLMIGNALFYVPALFLIFIAGLTIAFGVVSVVMTSVTAISTAFSSLFAS